MATFIRLNAAQNNTVQFDHPLLEGVKPYSDEELHLLINDQGALCLALRSCLRHTIGRYLAHYPSTVNYLDDMVSEGMLALIEFSSEISLDLLKGRGILKVAFQRLQWALNNYLNKAQGIGASYQSQKRRLAKGLDPCYLETFDSYPETAEPTDEDDIYKRDMLDALESIEAVDKTDAVLLCPLNWGRTGEELAEMLGVTRTTITNHKKRLYSEYLKLTQ